MTYGDIYKEFHEKVGLDFSKEMDFRPCKVMYGVPDIQNAIVVWLKDGGKIIYISDKKEEGSEVIL